MSKSPFANKDAISELPRNIMTSILERMPIRDAARTSILSSKWRYIWTTVLQLTLDDHFFQQNLRIKPTVQYELVNIVDKMLLLHDGPIQKVVLCLPSTLFDCGSDIDRWILFLSRNGIKDLTLHNSINVPYKMHSCIYSCRELTQLNLVNCVLKSPRELSVFQNVIKLHFTRITFESDMLSALVSMSKLLQSLTIQYCSDIGDLIINARNLYSLFIKYNDGLKSLSFVCTPNLWYLFILLRDRMPMHITCFLPMFLVCLPSVSELHLDGLFLQNFAAGVGLFWRPTSVTRVNSLSLYNMVFSDVGVFSRTLFLIQNCPNLTELSCEFVHTTHTSEDRVVNYLDSPACMDRTLAKLLSVNIKCLNGSKPQLLLIKLLLACSPMLETMSVQLSAQLDVNQGFKISKELSLFPRSSPKAAVIY